MLLTFLRDKTPWRGVCIDWSIGLWSMGLNLTSPTDRFCSLGGAVLDTNINGQRNVWGASLQRWDLGMLVNTRLSRSQQCALTARRANHIWGVSNMQLIFRTACSIANTIGVYLCTHLGLPRLSSPLSWVRNPAGCDSIEVAGEALVT